MAGGMVLLLGMNAVLWIALALLTLELRQVRREIVKTDARIAAQRAWLRSQLD